MNVGIACGGTGGHIFPGLATAEVLRNKGHKVTLILSGRDVESRSISGWTGPVLRVPAMSFGSPLSVRTFRAVVMLVRGVRRCRAEFRKERPDVLLAMGSYASLAPVLAASKSEIPVVLHEANAIPGKAIEWLKRYAKTVAVGFEEAARLIDHRNVVLTGFPVRAMASEPLDGGETGADKFTILVMGGSQGAHHINEIAASAFCKLQTEDAHVRVIHLSGMADEEFLRRQYDDAGVDARVFGFLEDMGSAYQSADFAISRAGAASCAELSVNGVPAVLVPLPSSARGHQLANARAAAAGGGMDVMEQGDLTAEDLADYLKKIAGRSSDKLDTMKRALQDTIHLNAAGDLAGVIEKNAGE